LPRQRRQASGCGVIVTRNGLLLQDADRKCLFVAKGLAKSIKYSAVWKIAYSYDPPFSGCSELGFHFFLVA